MKDYDVIIAGGGISGSMAGIAAARMGVKVLIIESLGFMGGALTAAGVGPMMTFHAGEKQVIKGITDELIERLKKRGKSPGHIQDSSNYTYTITPFDAEAMKYEIETMLVESGGEILYHTMLAGVNLGDRNIKSIKICNKLGLSEISAKVFIDATGDADLATWSGMKFTKGREKDGASQPLTLMMKIRDVNLEKVKDYIKKNPDNFTRIHKDISVIDKVSRLAIIGFVKEFDEAKKKGEISIKREDVLFFETNNLGEIIVNTTRILGCDSIDPLSLSKAEIEGRKQCKELELFFKKYIPGFENSVVFSTGPIIGVRSSRQIIGLYTLTVKDLLEQRKFKDVIAHSGYPIDIHSPDGEGTTHKSLNWGEYYGIPYSTLVASEIDNLIVVGRSISATFEAQGAIRTTPTVGAVGQAGGVAAALAVKDNKNVKNIDIDKLQKELLKQGAYLDI